MAESFPNRRVGLLVPSSDTVMEPDLWRRLPTDITLHISRMYMGSTTVAGEEKMLREELIPAAKRLASVKPGLIVFGCTSAAALHGLKGDAAIARQVTGVAGCPTITVTQAAIQEMKAIQPQRIFLFTPYVPDLTERLRQTFQEAGLPILGTKGLGLDQDLEIAGVSPAEIQEAIRKEIMDLPQKPDCIFISCTTFRAFEAADGIEKELGIPVVTSNKAAFQVMLRHI
jgi:maleate isomerase